jgi:hypothetical protein
MNFPSAILTLNTKETSAGQRWEHWRLRRHFARVERRLRARDVSDLPPHLQAARARNLDHLHEYALCGEFPRNFDTRFSQIPCFIDRDHRQCAVAHLIVASGHADLAAQIDAVAHNARIHEMRLMGLKALDDWAGQSGLTEDELVLIQPGYSPAEFLLLGDLYFVPGMFVVSMVNVGLVAMNINNLHTGRRSWGAIIPALLSIIGAVGALGFFVLSGIASFVLNLVLYFFQIVPLSAVTTYYAAHDSTQQEMAIPLLILVVATLATLAVMIWTVVAAVRVLRTAEWKIKRVVIE